MRNQGVILAVAISFLVISFVFIYVSRFYIPNQTKKISESFERRYSAKGVFVVTGEDGLDEGTIITDELFQEGTIQIQNIPSEFIPKKDNQELVYTTGEVTEETEVAYRDVIIGKMVKTKVEPGAMITFANLGEGEEVAVNSFDKQIQLLIENTVGDNLKTGKYVDVIVKYENGGFDVVASKKMVDSVITTGTGQDQVDQSAADSGETATIQAKASATSQGVILVSVNDTEYRDLEMASRLGTLSIRLYKSAEQFPAVVTFNYAGQSEEVNKKLAELEPGAHTSYYNEYVMYVNGKQTIDKVSETFVYMEWYSDLYYKLKPYFEGKKVYEKKPSSTKVETKTEKEKTTSSKTKDSKTNTKDNGKEKAEEAKVSQEDLDKNIVTISEIAKAGEVTDLDVVLALIMGNEKIYSTSNRLELFNQYLKGEGSTTTNIRKTVASDLVTRVLAYYTKLAGTNVDSLAYLIKNKFITSLNF